MKKLLLTTFVFLIAAAAFWWSWRTQVVSHLLQEAHAHEQQAQQAKTAAEQKAALNAALDNYLSLESSTQPVYGNGVLYRAIGNIYEQLGEFSLALYYDVRAATLMPRNKQVQGDIERVSKRLGQVIPPTSTFAPLFFFHTYLSLPERLSLFAICAALLFAVLWKLIRISQRTKLLKTAALVLSVLVLGLLGSLLYSRYGEPVKAVLLQAASLYKDPSKDHPPAVAVLAPGTRVNVLKQRANGTWLQVQTAEGTLGYVEYRALKIIGT